MTRLKDMYMDISQCSIIIKEEITRTEPPAKYLVYEG